MAPIQRRHAKAREKMVEEKVSTREDENFMQIFISFFFSAKNFNNHESEKENKYFSE